MRLLGQKTLLLGLTGALLVLAYIYQSIGAEVLSTRDRVIGATGISLVLLYLIADYGRILDTLSGRVARHNLIAVTLVLLLAGSAIGINIMAHQLDERWDLTADQSFSLSPQTVALLESIEEPIEVIGFFPSDSQEELYFYDLTTNMESHSQQLKIELYDPIRQPARARQHDITGTGVVLRRGEQTVLVQEPYDESKFRLALLQLENPVPHLLCFSSGHGEPELDELTQIGDFGIFVSLLEDMNYQAIYVDMLREEDIPPECTVFVASTLERDWGEKALQKVDRYLTRGGQVLAFPYLPPEDIYEDSVEDYLSLVPLNFHAHFARYGVELGIRPIEERDSAHLPPANLRPTTFFISPSGYGSHPIVEAISQERGSIVVMDAPSMQLVETEGIKHTPLMASSPVSISRSLDSTESAGPHMVGVVVELEDYSGPPEVTDSAEGGRLVILGSSWIAGNLLLMERSAFNADLVMNSVAWLAKEPTQLESRYRTDAPVPPILSESDLKMVRNIVLLFAPGLAMLGAIGTWRRRKRL